MKRILVIEDETNIRETLCDLLELNGFETIEAPDGNEGIKKAITESPDIIICDVNMPGINGYEVLISLKKKGKLPFISFIFLTANAAMDELRKGMELGADDYLIKPFTNASLIRTINAILDKRSVQIEKLHSLQNKLNHEKTRIRDIDQINSHEIRRKIALLQSLFPLIKKGEIPFHEGMDILETSGEEIDKAIRLLSRIIDEREVTQGQQNPDIKKVNSIWLIDDDRMQNMFNKMLLKKIDSSWAISEFTDPKIALEQLGIEAPDFIFLDISMPSMTGFEFLKRIQKKKDCRLKIAMLSSSISYRDIKQAISFSQVVSYITKPLKAERLRGFIC